MNLDSILVEGRKRHEVQNALAPNSLNPSRKEMERQHVLIG